MIPDAVVTGALRVRIAEGVDIREILRTPGGSLVAEEVSAHRETPARMRR